MGRDEVLSLVHHQQAAQVGAGGMPPEVREQCELELADERLTLLRAWQPNEVDDRDPGPLTGGGGQQLLRIGAR